MAGKMDRTYSSITVEEGGAWYQHDILHKEQGLTSGKFIELSMITIETSCHQCVPNAWTYGSTLNEQDYYRGFKSLLRTKLKGFLSTEQVYYRGFKSSFSRLYLSQNGLNPDPDLL